MKTFYTVRDIEDMHAAGVVEIETHEDVVVTDVAREKATALGMKLKPVDPGGARSPVSPAARVAATGAFPQTSAAPPASRSASPAGSGAASGELVSKVKAAVVQRLGTSKYDELLDRIIPQVIAQLKK